MCSVEAPPNDLDIGQSNSQEVSQRPDKHVFVNPLVGGYVIMLFDGHITEQTFFIIRVPAMYINKY